MDQILTLWPVLVVIAGAGSSFVAVRIGLQQVTKDVAELKQRTEENDKNHDRQLAEHDKRVAVLESRFDETIGAMKEQLEKIYNKLLG